MSSNQGQNGLEQAKCGRIYGSSLSVQWHFSKYMTMVKIANIVFSIFIVTKFVVMNYNKRVEVEVVGRDTMLIS